MTISRAFGWLYAHHPRTAIVNLPMLVTPVCKVGRKEELAPHGYWKDLLNIVALAAYDELSPTVTVATFLHPPREPFIWDKPERTREENLELEQRKRVESREKRVARHQRLHATLLKKLEEPRFRALYVAVARLFAERLLEDINLVQKAEALAPGEERTTLLRQVTLAGKWAPTLQGSHDRVTNIATAIALVLHHNQLFSYSKIPHDTPLSSDDTHILRSMYRRWVTTPLRKVKEVPESLMSTNRWSEIKYNHVPSVCMKNNTEHFYKHDTARFEQYLTDVENGKRTISGATLMPHTLLIESLACAEDAAWTPNPDKPNIRDFRKRLADTKVRGIEAQWRAMVDRLRESGALDNALAVCDVSGSMGDIDGGYGSARRPEPIAPAIALSLVLAQLAKPPFDHAFITFSAQPQFVRLDPALPLAQTVEAVASAHWGMNTAFDKVFLELLLPLAQAHGLRREDMIKRLFVFSDMQFDEAQPGAGAAGAWESVHDVVEKRFRDAGYDLPEIVYWNLSQGATTFPVTGERKGVAMMNGFSPAMLKVFMGEDVEDPEMEGFEVVEQESAKQKDAFDPVRIMIKAVSKESYNGLVVVD